MMEARIRYACVTSPGLDPLLLAYPYLKALVDLNIGVRIMPIGLALFDRPPWNNVGQVFTAELVEPYLNVVCVPAGLKLGAMVSAAQFGNPKAGQRTAYVPPTALVALCTEGVTNVAIIDGTLSLEPEEVEVLATKYSRVICPTTEGTTVLTKQGIPAATVSPDSDKLYELFSGMTPT